MTNKEALDKFLERVLLGIINQQRELGFRASGKSAASLYVESSDEKGQILGEQYIQTNFRGIGRKPGTMPPIQSIEAWIRQRGLSLNAWAVAKNIQKRGTAVYRGAREGIDMRGIMEEHIEQFKQDCLQALVDQAIYGIRAAKRA